MITAERSTVIGFGILFWTCLVTGLPLVALGLLGLCFLFIFAGGLDRVSRKWEPVQTRPDKDLVRRSPEPSPPTQEMRH